MKNYYVSILFFLASIITTNAQGAWTQKANVGGTSRVVPVSFAIGNKGYIGTGYDSTYGNKNDFWEYDQTSNTWTQMANFGGTARGSATGFSIGTKGYIGTGYDGSNRNDFWEYDQGSNIWTQKANFGGTGRVGAVGFAIGTKGYIGTGYDNSYRNDFWEYDTTSNTWTQKANFGGTARYVAAGFAIGTKGYIGTGYDSTFNNKNDFWEYDTTSNIWTQMANFGGTPRRGATGFSIGTKGFIGTGNIGSGVTNDFWEYDQGSNSWTQKANVGGMVRSSAIGLSIGTKGYIGTGENNSNVFANDFWEYSPDVNTCTPLITNGLIAYYPFCGNANDVSGNGNNGTVFGATLTTDRFGNANSAYSFDGISNYIQSTNINLHDTATISVWVYPLINNSTGGQSVALVDKNKDANTDAGYTLLYNNAVATDHGLYAQVGWSGDTNNIIMSHYNLSLNQWHHCTLTLNNGTAKLYLDGSLVCTKTGMNSTSQNNDDLLFGKSVWGGNLFQGKLDDIAIYNRTLSAQEINELYTGTAALNLKTFLEGFYTGSGQMTATLYNLLLITDATATDTIQVNLWLPTHLSNSSPDYSAKTILHSNGAASVSFPAAVIGNTYYISVKHRNHIETWSSNPVLFSATTSYDFTTAQTQAYSDGVNPPMKNINGVFAFYAGDANQDETVDIADMADVENDASNFLYGYNASDCNGNGATDASDMALVDNNAQLFLYFARPY